VGIFICGWSAQKEAEPRAVRRVDLKAFALLPKGVGVTPPAIYRAVCATISDRRGLAAAFRVYPALCLVPSVRLQGEGRPLQGAQEIEYAVKALDRALDGGGRDASSRVSGGGKPGRPCRTTRRFCSPCAIFACHKTRGQRRGARDGIVLVLDFVADLARAHTALELAAELVVPRREPQLMEQIERYKPACARLRDDAFGATTRGASDLSAPRGYAGRRGKELCLMEDFLHCVTTTQPYIYNFY
jgi:hypothetical protein